MDSTSPTPAQTIDTAALTKLLWQGLKDRCCSNPAKAVRIVMLNEADVKLVVEKNAADIAAIIRGNS